jgi:hypothetical protein
MRYSVLWGTNSLGIQDANPNSIVHYGGILKEIRVMIFGDEANKPKCTTHCKSFKDATPGDGIIPQSTVYVKLLPLPQPPVRARTDARTHGRTQAPREPPN